MAFICDKCKKEAPKITKDSISSFWLCGKCMKETSKKKKKKNDAVNGQSQ